MRGWRRPHLGSEADHATFRTLHRASLAAPALREGLTPASAERSIRHLRVLLGTPALALSDREQPLAWDGAGQHHLDQVAQVARRTVERGRTRVVDGAELACDEVGCPVRVAVVSPLVVEDRVVGTLQAMATHPTAGLARAADEVAQWVSGQLALAELDASRTRLMEAEVRALRAQISPHFIYNSLGAIASFVRTDPDRARALLLEFADFTRYSFRSAGEFTTLADELRNIDRYLTLERARFGDRLEVVVQVAPEVLGVTLPFLALQPLVENAVRHGLAPVPHGGTITLTAEDVGTACVISVDDDGVGMDPGRLDQLTSETGEVGAHVGLRNVDDRLRAVFGDDYGLAVETALGAGTRVSLRVPKFAPDVRS